MKRRQWQEPPGANDEMAPIEMEVEEEDPRIDDALAEFDNQ